MCDEDQGETALSCVDCYCGDGVCDPTENTQSCMQDCACDEDGTCDADQGETAVLCPADCSCGDGICDDSESAITCSADC